MCGHNVVADLPPGHRWLCALLALPMPPFLAMRGHIRHLLSPRLIAWPCVAWLPAPTTDHTWPHFGTDVLATCGHTCFRLAACDSL